MCVALAIDHAVKLAAAPLLLPDSPDEFAKWALEQDAVIRGLADGLASGMDKAAWMHHFDRWVRDGHLEAHRIGQRAAGGTVQEALAVLRARSIADQESEYIQGFFAALVDGRYSGDDGINADAVYYRSRLYLGKMRGTAGYGFVDNSDSKASFEWVMSGLEEHCPDCPVLAEGGPYTQETLYTTPGACDTPCLGNCKCHLVRDDGAVSAQALRIGD